MEKKIVELRESFGPDTASLKRKRINLLYCLIEEALRSKFGMDFIVTFPVEPSIKVGLNTNRKQWACEKCGKLMRIGEKRVVLSVTIQIGSKRLVHRFSFCNYSHLKNFLQIGELKRRFKFAKRENLDSEARTRFADTY